MRQFEYDGICYSTLRLAQAARREHYLALLKSGMNSTQAAREVGVSKRTAKVWRNGRTRTTGRDEKPAVDWYRGDMELPKKIHSRYLSQEERVSISDGLHHDNSLRAIAKRLNRNVTSISREVARGTNPVTGRYEPYWAQQQSTARLARPKAIKITRNPALKKEIQSKLEKHWSPEQISGWLKLTWPDNEAMNVCHETIYQAVYVQARGELRLDVKRALRTGRARRRPRTGEQNRKPRFREPMLMISERPADVEDRAVPGHWEGDLITGAHNKSAIGTLVERASGFTLLLHLPDRHDAETVQQAIITKMGRLPALLRNTLTWDQGSELALHQKIKTSLDMEVYFCDPHSPWQRGTNENTNGLLRQYFPKGTDLSIFPEEYLDAVAEELNDRPRKRLGFAKPAEKILELINESC
jgi:IS30 family transposase